MHRTRFRTRTGNEKIQLRNGGSSDEANGTQIQEEEHLQNKSMQSTFVPADYRWIARYTEILFDSGPGLLIFGSKYLNEVQNDCPLLVETTPISGHYVLWGHAPFSGRNLRC